MCFNIKHINMKLYKHARHRDRVPFMGPGVSTSGQYEITNFYNMMRCTDE
jgi:hypothetical protein